MLIPEFGLLGAGIASLFSIIISRIYRIVLGLHYYGTERREWKIALLWLICAVAAVFTMYSTTIVSDITVCITLCILSLVVINTEGVNLVKKMNGLLFSKKI